VPLSPIKSTGFSPLQDACLSILSAIRAFFRSLFSRAAESLKLSFGLYLLKERIFNNLHSFGTKAHPV
jgi:hypothetical protein